MILRPPRSTRTYTLFPSTTLCRSTLPAAGMSPVVAPIGVGTDGATYNINADTITGAVAAAAGASRLFLLTDVAGVLDKQKNLLTDLTPPDIAVLRRSEEHTSALQSLMRISYAVFCMTKKTKHLTYTAISED